MIALTATWLMCSQLVLLAQATKPSRLINAWTSQSSIRAWSATYYFTIEVGTNTRNPVTKVVLNQYDGLDTIKFYVQQSEVFAGDRSNPGARLPLQSVVADPQTRTVTIQFEQPVPPGQRFTIALNPTENPDTAGIYQFGITIFSQPEQQRGLFLGFGRLHFYDGGGSDLLLRWRR
ncbi:MAG: DUF2808 domain-containing protein [Cyanobacteria bacterium]|nr:DUF2808 domain-containing protein [Cyanobacteriota bacterium]MDW8200413.1 DUF2808 domain-containing protein [Cyanobacteriota bacterium SKYGB_h_bin112]